MHNILQLCTATALAVVLPVALLLTEAIQLTRLVHTIAAMLAGTSSTTCNTTTSVLLETTHYRY
jgi:hypothetical protein